MQEHRRFHRIQPPSRTAIIFADRKSPANACSVIDISAGGACLEIHGNGVIPKRFILNHGGVQKNCRVVWQKSRRIGVSF